MDFFDQHAYGFDEDKFSKSVEISRQPPTTFTEWGWRSSVRKSCLRPRL
jgi:hypothetical protein